MLKHFQKYSFISIYITIFFLVLLWLNSFFKTGYDIVTVQNYSNTPIFDSIEKSLSNYHFLKSLITFILFSIQAYFVIFISLKFDIFDANSYIGGFVFIILSGFAYIQQFSGIMFANIFLFWGMLIFLRLNTLKKSVIDAFNIGILFSIASFFYYPYFFLLFFGIIGTIIIRSKITKEIIVFLASFIIMYILYVEILYLTKTHINVFEIINEYLTHTQYKITRNELFFVLPAFIFLISNIYILAKINTKEIEKRTIFQLFFALFIFILIMNISFNQAKHELIFSTFFPISILVGDFFSKLKTNRINNFLFYLFVFNSIIFQILIIYVL